MKYLKLFENYENGEHIKRDIEDIFKEVWNYSLNSREEIIKDRHILKGRDRIESFTGIDFGISDAKFIGSVSEFAKKLNFAKDDGYYYLSISRSFRGLSEHYFRFDKFSDLLFYLDAYIVSKFVESMTIGGIWRGPVSSKKTFEEIMDIYNISHNDTYFKELISLRDEEY